MEKPEKLTADEFAEMKIHAGTAYCVLRQILEIPDIVKWASNNHKKLNGTGYPQGSTPEGPSFEEQLMACIDIIRH